MTLEYTYTTKTGSLGDFPKNPLYYVLIYDHNTENNPPSQLCDLHFETADTQVTCTLVILYSSWLKATVHHNMLYGCLTIKCKNKSNKGVPPSLWRYKVVVTCVVLIKHDVNKWLF